MSLQPEQKQEFLHALSHGLGIVLYVAASPLMIASAAIHSNVPMLLATTLYCFTLLMTFATSTLYHAFEQPELKRTLRVLDHCAIFLLIAGTYTPLLLRYSGVMEGMKYLVIIWAIAIAGVLFKLFFTGKWRSISVLFYVGLAGVCVLFSDNIFSLMSDFTWHCVLYGGISYLVGAAIYATPRIPYFHLIWHIFVLIGSFLHFVGITFAILHS